MHSEGEKGGDTKREVFDISCTHSLDEWRMIVAPVCTLSHLMCSVWTHVHASAHTLRWCMCGHECVCTLTLVHGDGCAPQTGHHSLYVLTGFSTPLVNPAYTSIPPSAVPCQTPGWHLFSSPFPAVSRGPQLWTQIPRPFYWLYCHDQRAATNKKCKYILR